MRVFLLSPTQLETTSTPTRTHTHIHTHLGLIKRLLHPEEVCVGSLKRGQSLHLNTTLNSGAVPHLFLCCFFFFKLDHSCLQFTFSLPRFSHPPFLGVGPEFFAVGKHRYLLSFSQQRRSPPTVSSAKPRQDSFVCKNLHFFCSCSFLLSISLYPD